MTMKKILNIISSPRGEQSFSIKLANAVIDKLLVEYPNSTVHTHDLTNKPFPHLEEAHITSFYTPAEQQTEENKAAIQHSDTAIKEIMDADILVIGVPVYNFNITSTLKAWIDHIARAGVTFSYSDKGPEGLVKNKKAYLAIATGGIYTEGFLKTIDFVEPYLRHMLGFLGITDVTIFRVEGLSMPGVKDLALQKAIDSIVIENTAELAEA